LSIGAALAGCSTLTPTEDPVYLRLTDLEARLMRIERVVNNESLIELASRIEQLQSETQMLRGEVETLRFETENSATRQRELYLDIDQRLQALETSQTRGGFAAPGGNAGGAAGGGFQGGGFDSGAGAAGGSAQQGGAFATQPQVSGSDQDNYQAAFDLIQARRYQDAGAAFANFLAAFPSSPLADNAQYWLAETLYVQRQFREALPEFQKVIDQFPQSAKIPDALLKVGYCNFELQQWNQARAALEQLTRQYPDTTAARLAAQRLERIAQEGG
jgi:tol-pal system protein YbgF